MISLMQTFNALALDRVLQDAMQEAGTMLSDHPPLPEQPFGNWLREILMPVPEALRDRRAARAFVAYLTDQFWEDNKSDNALAALAEIEAAAQMVKSMPHYDQPDMHPSLSASMMASVKMLRFLHTTYIPFLQERFSGAFLVGSMNYGRFFSIKGAKSRNPSDIDLFLVAKEPHIAVEDFQDKTYLVDSSGGRERLQEFSASMKPGGTDIISYKLTHKSEGFDVSLTMGTEDGLRNILDLESKDEKTSSLNRPVSMCGRQNILLDFAGCPYEETYQERPLKNGYLLSVPVMTYGQSPQGKVGRINGFAALFLPRIDALFSTPGIDAVMASFVHSLCNLAQDFRHTDNNVSICNTHLRQQNFSPFFKKKMDIAYGRRMK